MLPLAEGCAVVAVVGALHLYLIGSVGERRECVGVQFVDESGHILCQTAVVLVDYRHDVLLAVLQDYAQQTVELDDVGAAFYVEIYFKIAHIAYFRRVACHGFHCSSEVECRP